MEKIENFKIDRWYKIIIVTGGFLVFASLHYKVDFIPQKYLFGFGIGLLLTGLSYFKADKTISEIHPRGILSYDKHIPDLISALFLLSGLSCLFFFGYKMSFYLFK